MEIYPQPLYADGDSRITFTFTNIKLASEKNRIESKRTTDLCMHIWYRECNLGYLGFARTRAVLVSVLLLSFFSFLFVRAFSFLFDLVIYTCSDSPTRNQKTFGVPGGLPNSLFGFCALWDTCLCWPLRPTIRYSFTPVYSRLEELDTHYLHGHVPLVEVNTKLLCLSPLPRSAVSSLSVLSFPFFLSFTRIQAHLSISHTTPTFWFWNCGLRNSHALRSLCIES